MKRFVIAILALFTIAVLAVVVYLYQSRELVLPPRQPALPAGAYDESHVSAKEAEFTKLADEYRADANRPGETGAQLQKRIGDKYNRRFTQILGASNSPEDLAMLALWAYHQPGFWGDNVYDGLFFGNIALLGKMKDDRAKYALWRIRKQVQDDGKFDAHYAETIIEAEEMQSKR